MLSKLVKYVRDGISRQPIATIVALNVKGDLRMGVSICSEKDHFDKKRGIHIAEARAHAGIVEHIPRRKIFDRALNVLSLETAINDEIEQMEIRARKYFKF